MQESAAAYVVCLGRGYVFFALENPALYHLMFGGEMAELIDLEGVGACAGLSYQLLVDGVTRCTLLTSSKQQNVELDTATAWCLVQGRASLLLANKLSPQRYGFDEVKGLVDAMLQRFLEL